MYLTGMYRSDSPMVNSEKCASIQSYCSADGVMQTVLVESSHCLASQGMYISCNYTNACYNNYIILSHAYRPFKICKSKSVTI